MVKVKVDIVGEMDGNRGFWGSCSGKGEWTKGRVKYKESGGRGSGVRRVEVE